MTNMVRGSIRTYQLWNPGTEFRGGIRRRYIIFFEWRAYIFIIELRSWKRVAKYYRTPVVERNSKRCFRFSTVNPKSFQLVTNQEKASPVVGLPPLASGPAEDTTFPLHLMERLYRRDSVPIAFSVEAECTTELISSSNMISDCNWFACRPLLRNRTSVQIPSRWIRGGICQPDSWTAFVKVSCSFEVQLQYRMQCTTVQDTFSVSQT
ncbi:hypothetical protein ANN_22822 [Periplaneta americana]|uniref:Uncharacterized protein n=1 Tax=Periplaneta americana TaxID=6978 RepID=A0ABQ8SKI7_PERAM|nr:hypothetical protein ANN_22822 [Periplaneta americana]